MARARVSDTFIDSNGRPVVNAAITVYAFGTTTPAGVSLYAGNTGVTPFNGVTDAAGRFEFWVDTPDRYSIKISSPSTTDVTQTYEARLDPDDEIRTSGSQSRATGLTTEGMIANNPTLNNPSIAGLSATNPTFSGGAWTNGTLNTPSLTTPTMNGTAKAQDQFKAYGNYGANPLHYAGLQVSYDGSNPYMVIPWVGLIESGGDSPWNGGALGRSWIQASRANTTRINEILTDIQFRSFNPGILVASGVVSGGSATTLTGAGFSAAWIGKNVRHLNSAGQILQTRIVANVSGGNTIITPGVNFSPSPVAGDLFEIVDANDEVALKVISVVEDGAVTWGRGQEMHLTRRKRAGNASLSVLHLGLHNAKQSVISDESQMILMMSQANDLTDTYYPTDIGILMAGGLGYNKFLDLRAGGGDPMGGGGASVADWLGDGALWALDVRTTQQASLSDPGSGKTRIGAITGGRVARRAGGAAQVLVADQDSAWTLIAQAAGTGASGVIEFSGIPATFRSLYIEYAGRSDTAATTTGVRMTFETSPTAGAYNYELLQASATTVTASEALGAPDFISAGSVPGASSTANLYGSAAITLPEYANTSMFKTALVNGGGQNDLSSTGGITFRFVGGVWESTTAIDRIRLTLAAGNWTAASRISLWGRPSY